jgi:hypothetical protein
MAGLEAPWELTGEGNEKGKERRGRGVRPRRGGYRGAMRALPCWYVACCIVRFGLWLCVREGAGNRRKEKKRRKEKEEKERKKRKKYGKFSKLWKILKNKR